MTFDLPMGRSQPRAWRWAVATIVAVVLSLVACAVLVVWGKAVFPSTDGYAHYAFADYGKLTIIGVVLACLAWPAVTLISSRAVRPFLLLTVVVTIVGLAPDAYILSRGQSPQAVLILVLMHVALALITFPALVFLAPQRTRGAAPARVGSRARS
jgi:hypothetical protein